MQLVLTDSGPIRELALARNPELGADGFTVAIEPDEGFYQGRAQALGYTAPFVYMPLIMVTEREYESLLRRFGRRNEVSHV